MKIQLLKKSLSFVALLAFTRHAIAQDLPDFTALVEKNAPAIVKVGTTRTSEEMDPAIREKLEELQRYFYGDRAPELELMPQPEEQERGATGSGFIIDSSGYIVTNHHVVDGADDITVTLYDQRELRAKVVGTDESSDLALLKVESQNLPVVELGDSSKLKVGEWVLAMGSPFGLQFSVAAGIISYMGRALPSESTSYVSYIQTDVAINPGHSGGPLFNLAGEVIGINSQIFTNSGGSIGLSFAIPVDVAKNVVAQLRTNGSVSRGYIGIGYEDVSQALAEAFNLETPHGALVNRVVPGGAADTAGIEVGDIVVAVNGNQIRTGPDLPYFVGLLLPGAVVEVEIIRGGQSQNLQMTLGSRDLPVDLGAATPAPQANTLGLVVSALDEDLRRQLVINHGVLVEEVEGAAEEAGLLPGDIIITLNNVEIDSQDDLLRVAAALPVDRPVPVLVARGEGRSFFTIRLSE
ncbi:MAG: HtrA protease/chaperone protein [Pseudomonadota bacterium]|jgi:serine protease Do